MKKHKKGFAFRLTGMILGFTALAVAITGMVFSLIGWHMGKANDSKKR